RAGRAQAAEAHRVLQHAAHALLRRRDPQPLPGSLHRRRCAGAGRLGGCTHSCQLVRLRRAGGALWRGQPRGTARGSGHLPAREVRRRGVQRFRHRHAAAVFQQGARHARAARAMKRLAIIRQAAWLTMLAAGAAGAASPELRSMLEGEEVPPGLSIRAGAFRTDNIDRVPDQEEDERVNVFELLANWEYEGPRIDALLLGNASYRDYQDARFDNEWRGNLFAGANFAIVRDMFEWQLNGQFGNAVIDPLDTGGPDNVQRIDVLETGPIVRLRAGSADSFDIGVARAEVNAEVSQIDHSRDTANVQWTHEFSSRSNMGIFAGVSRLGFDEGQDAEDYDRREAYLSWESSGNNRWYSLGAGRARIEFDSGVKHAATVGWLRASLRRTRSSRV